MKSASFSKILAEPGMGYAILGLVAIAAFLVLKKTVSDVAGVVGDGVSGIAEGIGGIATGHNTITAGTPYEGAGVFGTLGAGANDLSGGGLEAVGDWIGGTLYDWFGADDATNVSQSATGNPYSPTGPNATYRKAANDSPLNAQYRISDFAVNGG